MNSHTQYNSFNFQVEVKILSGNNGQGVEAVEGSEASEAGEAGEVLEADEAGKAAQGGEEEEEEEEGVMSRKFLHNWESEHMMFLNELEEIEDPEETTEEEGQI